MSTKTEREQFRSTIEREYPGDIRAREERVRQLQRNAQTHNRLSEEVCCVEVSEREEVARDRRIETCEARISAVCAEFPKRWRVTHTDTDGRLSVQFVATGCKDNGNRPGGVGEPGFLSEDSECFGWLLKHQSASVDHACKHEGYKIESVGMIPDFGGDPRGYTVCVHVPSRIGNTWGGAESGLGVPCGNS